VYITAAATTSPAQRDVIRSAAVKRSLYPIRHANRGAQAAALIRDFTSPPIKRSPFSLGDIFNKIGEGIGQAVDTVVNGVDKVADKVAEGLGQAIGTVGNEIVKAEKKIGEILDKGTGAVVDFVDAVRNHRVSPLVDTERRL
jgi:hypothetical protein